MRLPWNKSKATQLDLLDEVAPMPTIERAGEELKPVAQSRPTLVPVASPNSDAPRSSLALPLMVPVTLLDEDPNNPRTEFPEAALEELAADIHQRGVLQPLVVHPADSGGRYRIHFGAKRLRAAIRAGLHEVPVVVRDMPADRYAQVAENQKRHALTPLDMARFIRAQVDAGDSNATIARQLGMNLTTVAHHLALLELPPELNEALKSGRCTSPRTLHELSKLHDERPEQVQGLLASGTEITRTAVSALRDEPEDGAETETGPWSSNRLIARPTRPAIGWSGRLAASSRRTPSRSRCPS